MREEEGYNILIVDDNRAIIESFTATLRNEKLIGSIQSAANGEEAIEKLQRGDIECVLMDLHMPVLDGYEATRIIKKLKPNIKVLIISMWLEEQELAGLYGIGADACLLKDTKTTELLAAIETVMSGSFYSSANTALPYYKEQVPPGRSSESAILTAREKEIIRCIASNMGIQKIAEKLFLQPQTIDAYKKNILAKLGLKNTASLLKYAQQNNL